MIFVMLLARAPSLSPVVQLGDDLRDVARPGAVLEQQPHHPVDLRRHRDQPVDAFLAFQVLGEGQGRRSLQEHEIVI